MTIILLQLFNTAAVKAQVDSINWDLYHVKPVKKKALLSAAAPLSLIGYGIFAQNNAGTTQLDERVNVFLQTNPERRLPVDDYTQYSPLFFVFALDAAGIEAKHTLKERMASAAFSHLIMAATVNIMKNSINSWRPDQSASNSFPSGHTATAFVGAELLWQEYHENSIWYGIAGYGIATATGFFRMHNNRHWFSDISMGAGIGILSTKLVYWLSPKLTSSNSHKEKRKYTIYPDYARKQYLLCTKIFLD